MPHEPQIYHYSHDVMQALIEAIPLITRSKQDVVSFFRGCGVQTSIVEHIAAEFGRNSSYSKYHATRYVLETVNRDGDSALRARREIIRRVAEFEDYSLCWPNNALQARGAVSAVCDLVNRRDSFTRMQQAYESEERAHRTQRDEELARVAAKRREIEQVRDDLFALFGLTDANSRGKKLEGILNRLFNSAGIGVREAFEVRLNDAGVVEQIDGAVDIGGAAFLVEMKWWEKKISRAEVSPHLVSVYGRGDTGGIFISASGYNDSAINEFEKALTQKTVILVELEEIVWCLNNDESIAELLRLKIQEARLTRNPLHRPFK